MLRLLRSSKFLWPLLLIAPAAMADITNCACDPARPESMQARECGLSREAAKQPPHLDIFFLKDISPRKPNRWLALPRLVGNGPYHLYEMDLDARTRLWVAAIEKAKELWGDGWGLAYNSESVRTQCHLHIHIGKLLKGLAERRFIEVNGPREIPAPKDGSGVWVHPVGRKLRVHLGEGITETVLLR